MHHAIIMYHLRNSSYGLQDWCGFSLPKMSKKRTSCLKCHLKKKPEVFGSQHIFSLLYSNNDLFFLFFTYAIYIDTHSETNAFSLVCAYDKGEEKYNWKKIKWAKRVKALIERFPFHSYLLVWSTILFHGFWMASET